MLSSYHMKLFTLIFLVLIMVSFALAEAPKLISYQGKATNSSGNPVSNGAHAVQFHIYDKYNNLQWSESVTVTTSEGLFSHNLGSVTPLDPTDFNWNDSLFLQVTFEGEVQSPRTIFTASPYAYYVNSIDNSDGGIVNDYITVHSDAADDEVVGIEASTGNGKIWLKEIDGNKRITLDAAGPSLTLNDYTYADSAFVTASSFEIPHAKMIEDPDGNAGFLGVYRSGGNRAFMVDGNYAGYGFPIVSIKGDASETLFAMNATGTDCVQLPANAIKSPEIANEAGVGSYLNATGYTISATAPATYLGSRAMFAPSNGYVLVTATASIEVLHTYNISDEYNFGVSSNCTSLHSACEVSLRLSGSLPTGTYRHPVTAQALFPIDSGTTTYCFMGEKITGASCKVGNITITELFVPTAYTTVIQPSAVAPPLDPDDEKVRAIFPRSPVAS